MSSRTRQRRAVIIVKAVIFFAVSLGLGSILLFPSRVTTQATEACIQPPSGIIAWWPFDETSGTTAQDIVGVNPGVHVNGPVSTTGQVDGSLRFDGVDDYVGVGD